jgi:hypothetical protein
VSWANIRVNLLSASKKELHFQLTRGQQDDQTTLRHQYDMRVTEKKPRVNRRRHHHGDHLEAKNLSQCNSSTTKDLKNKHSSIEIIKYYSSYMINYGRTSL